MMPMYVHIKTVNANNKKFRLWIPLIIVWLIVIPLMLILVPLFLITCAVLWLNPFKISAGIFQVISATKGTRIEVNDKNNTTLIDVN